MKRLIVLSACLFLFVLTGCATTAWRSIVPYNPTISQDQSKEIQKKRHLKVGIIAEKYDDSMYDDVVKGFKEMEEHYGICAGAVTYIPISFKGVKTSNEAWKAIFAQICPLGPTVADVFVVYSSRIWMEDIFFLISGGMVPITFGQAELVFDRFVLLRMKSTTMLVHELEHLFGARDSWGADKNLQAILSNKWRRFDGWYVRNHPELDQYREPEKPVWTEEEYVKVVERAKERAQVKMEEHYKKYPYLRDWKTPYQFDKNWKEGDPLPEAYINQVDKYYDQITNPDLIGLKEVEARRKKK